MATKHNAKPPAERMVQARIPADLYDDFERIAREHERSLSGELRRVMREHVEAHTDGPKVAA